MADAFIQELEDLEEGLGTVPGYDGTKSGGFRVRFEVWKERLIRVRKQVYDLCEDDPAAQALENARCAQSAAYFLAMYCWVDEPRPRKGEDVYKPFVPSAAQVELTQWLQASIESSDPSDGYISKSRGWGATRTVVSFAVWGLIYRQGWRGLLVSRKEDLVDKPLDLNSMFGFADFQLKYLQPWQKPEGFDPRYHRLKLMIKNPANGSQITGESTTTKAGRGARATYVIVDEAAFIPDFVMMFGTLSGTTDHRIALSTESFEEGFEWYETWQRYKHDTNKVKQLEVYDNPWMDEYKLAEEELRWEHDPDGFQREYMRDPYAGYGQAVYPIAKDLNVVPYFHDEDRVLLVGIDPGRADDTAMVFAQFQGDHENRKLVWLGSYEKNLMPAEFYAHILTGIEPEPGDPCHIYWDSDGRLRFTDRDKEVMEWLRDVPYRYLRTFCDPAGSARDMSGLSFIDRLLIESKRLRKREWEKARAAGIPVDDPKGIAPLYKDLFAKNRHDSRRSALRKMLPNTVFADTYSANNRLRTAFLNYRFSEPGSKATGEPSPIHDQFSHLVSAAEYLAVYVDLGVAEPRNLQQAAA